MRRAVFLERLLRQTKSVTLEGARKKTRCFQLEGGLSGYSSELEQGRIVQQARLIPH